MAKDDYFVIVYKILQYLYKCLKRGESPDINILSTKNPAFDVPESYWTYIIVRIYEDGYVQGVEFTRAMGGYVILHEYIGTIQITPLGIEYLQENATMNKVFNILKGTAEAASWFMP